MSDAVSFAPKDFGTGRFSGGKVTLDNARIEVFDFRGKAAEKVGVWITMTDVDGNPHDQFYSIGDPKYVSIKDEDGNDVESGIKITSIDPDKPYKLSPNSSYGKFVGHAFKAGMPENLLAKGDIRVFNGMEVQVDEIALPKMEGAEKQSTMLVISKIFSSTSTTGKTAQKGASKSNGADAEDLDLLTTNTAVKILTSPADYIKTYKGDGLVKKKELAAAVFTALQGHALKGKVAKRIVEDSFLEAGNGENWMYDADDQTVTGL